MYIANVTDDYDNNCICTDNENIIDIIMPTL